MVVEAWERDVAARQAKGFLDAAHALARYEMQPSGAAVAHARAYGEAVAAFTTALNATIIYLQDIEWNPARKTRERDVETSQLWANAHAALFAFDTDLAQRCFIKSQGWLDPKIWSSPEFASIGVSINDMRQALLAFQKQRGGAYPALEKARRPKKGTIADRITKRWTSSQIGSAVILLLAVVVALGTFIDNISKIEDFIFPAKAENPAPPTHAQMDATKPGPQAVGSP